jgi:lysyl-tRNA synthetase class II
LLRIRNYLSKEGYFEVTLPVLTDGEISSKAHSYVTYPYRYKGKLFLRKTMDPFLRMLSCYDFEKVFSFGKCFRNEYITSTKQSEFEMLSIFSNYQKEEEAIKLALGIIEQIIPKSEVKVKYYDHSEYKRSREKLLIEVIKNFPNKKNSYASLKEDGTTREFKIKIKGITVVHGLMEIKNYEEYISKVKDQGKSENYGELEKLEKALQYGAPPCYNLGISITRIFMVYHNLSIKEIEPFPLSRLNMDQDG